MAAASPRMVKAAADLDRGVTAPHFTADGRAIDVIVADDRSAYPARIPLSGGTAQKLMQPPIVMNALNQLGGCSAAIVASDTRPNEIFAFENGSLRQLTHQNGEIFAQIDIPPTEDVSFKSKDGTEVHGLLTKPVGYTAGAKVPLLLRIHGGPNGQDAHSFSPETQWFTANGYAVLAVNYRGSSGRGQKFSRAIFADWGHYEVEDLEAGVDQVIKMGIADPARLGVGGWSYGAHPDRLHDRDRHAFQGRHQRRRHGVHRGLLRHRPVHHSIRLRDRPAMEELRTYVKISYPFLHADRIKTPTMFLGGERDFNVPVQGGQQMYQALRSLGIDTQLIIYPNETHGIQRPSYQRDRLERYLGWYDKYLKKGATGTVAEREK